MSEAGVSLKIARNNRWVEMVWFVVVLAIIMQILLLGVSVLLAFGPKIASTTTIDDTNQFPFACCFHLIF